MKNSKIVFTAALRYVILTALVCASFITCENPVMKKWWDDDSNSGRSLPLVPAYHTVNFLADGGLPAPLPQNIAHEGRIPKILPMSKEHCAFDGWYKDPNFNSEWDFAEDAVISDINLFAKWHPIADVTIDFVANGGEPEPVPNPQKIIKDTIVTMPEPMTKASFGFDGWYTEPEFIHKWNFSFVAAGSHTLYARWEDNSTLFHKVEFIDNGGTPVPAVQQIADRSQIIEPLPMSRSGYAFGGWYEDVNLEYKWDFSRHVVTGGDITLYAKWEAYFFNVTFMANSGSPPPLKQQIAMNEKAVEPPPISRPGYGFGGWFTDEACTIGNEWDFTADTVTSDLNLYAKWVEPQYLVEFEANNGTPPPASQNLPAGSKVVEPPPMTRLDGPDDWWSFGGWFTDEACTIGNEWNFAADTVYAGLTLYAKWEAPRQCLVTFESYGGTPKPNAQYLIDGTKIVVPIPMSLFGHGFGGWYTDPSFSAGSEWNFNTPVGAADFTLYAKWVPDKYTVIFEEKGGLPKPEVQNIVFNTPVTRPAAMLKTGENFGGWYTDEACTIGNEWNFAANVTEELTENGILRLYARWEILPKVFTVTFNAGGGSPEPAVQNILENTRVIEPPAMRKAKTTEPGYETWWGFGGWYTDAACTTGNEWNFATDTVSIGKTTDGGITLYAKWIDPPSCTVTFEAYGGDPIPITQDLYVGTKVVEPLTMIKLGYGFGGWYKDPNFTAGSEWNFNTPVSTEDFTLYARWVANYYTVAFVANGGTPVPASQKVTHSALLASPPVMKKSGQSFMGWYTDDVTFANEWDFSSDRVDRDGIVLYARWGQPFYLVKFNLKLPPGTSGPSVPQDQELSRGRKISEPVPANPSGWSFSGWYYFDNLSDNDNPDYNRNNLKDWDFDWTVDLDASDDLVIIKNGTTEYISLIADGKGNEILYLHARWVPNVPDMVWVRKGSFTMGSASSGASRMHNVKFGTGYYISDAPVTQNEYKKVMKDDFAVVTNTVSTDGNPSQYTGGREYANVSPVERVSWYDAVMYCQTLTKQHNVNPALDILEYAYEIYPNPPASYTAIAGMAGSNPFRSLSDADVRARLDSKDYWHNGYRLPTEAEWEYAARGGNGTPGNFTYSGSNNADEVAWYNTNVKESAFNQGGTQPVKKKLPNVLRIFDMSGNISEWCWDWYSTTYYTESNNSVDPMGPLYGTEKARRGGSWSNVFGNTSTTLRDKNTPDTASWVNGFRVVRGVSVIY